MAWRAIAASDVMLDFTPAEIAMLQSIQNSQVRLATKLSDTALEFIGAISAAQGPDSVVTDGRVPDQLRSHIMALACWRWLRGFPQLKIFKTKEREDAYKDAQRIYEKIAARTYGAIESPYCVQGSSGNWNSENKLIIRTHPVPPPWTQFPPQLNGIGTLDDDDSVASVFSAVAGTVPPFTPSKVGQEAFNQQTGESWFVNTNYQWQQQVAV